MHVPGPLIVFEGVDRVLQTPEEIHARVWNALTAHHVWQRLLAQCPAPATASSA